MQNKFIYVFSKDARDKMLHKGFNLLKNDELGLIFVFDSESNSKYSISDLDDVSYILSDTLTF